MPDDKEHGEGFKVVDRRLFSEDGKLRGGVNEDAGRTAPAVTPSRIATPDRPAPPPAREVPTRAQEEAPASDEELAADFEMLVSYLSTTVMFQLGLLPGPGGERISPDLANARRTIDLLGVLEQKSRGNLSAEEAQLLEEVLADLRMGYVETENQLSKKRK